MALPPHPDPDHPCGVNGCGTCDRCERCEAGDCCGADVMDANLPPLAPGSHHAPLGALLEVDGGVVCHECGWVGDGLYAHVRKHDLTPAAYRSRFGLGVGTPLCSSRLREERRAAMSNRDARPNIADLAPTFSPEQRSRWSRDRVARLEHAGFSDSEAQSRRARAGAQQLRDDPERAQAKRRKLIIAKRHSRWEEGLTCVVCGARFCRLTGVVTATCGAQECTSEQRRKAQRASVAARSSTPR